MITQVIQQNRLKINEYSHYSYNTTVFQNRKNVKKEKDEFESHIDLYIGQYGANGKIEPKESQKFNLILAMKTQIEDQVKEITNYYKSIFEENIETSRAKVDFTEYLEENPEDLEKIEQGVVPEYWNKENTAKRIFDIALLSFNKDDNKEDFYENSKKFIKQAYSEVEKLIGKLPDLVIETKEAVLKGLDDFRNGIDSSEIDFS